MPHRPDREKWLELQQRGAAARAADAMPHPQSADPLVRLLIELRGDGASIARLAAACGLARAHVRDLIAAGSRAIDD